MYIMSKDDIVFMEQSFKKKHNQLFVENNR